MMVKTKPKKKRGIWKILLTLLIIAAIFYVTWFFLGRQEECSDRSCFESKLELCKRVRFVGGSEMIYEYLIQGKTGDFCEVKVRLLKGELNNQNSIALEGKEMICEIPLGVIMNPESDISQCHGLLKEGLQDLIIQKLHTYLVQNVGKINQEIANASV